MQQEGLTINTELIEGRIGMIQLAGSLDSHTFDMLQQAIADYLDRGTCRIILDMSELIYISSAGAGVLVGAMSQAEAADGRLVLLNVVGSVAEVLQTLGLTELFRVAADKYAAIELCA